MSGGNGRIELLDFNRPPQRVVSLVPSMTDSLIELGAGSSLVGVTDFCPAYAASEKPPARIGGTKSPAVETIIGLQPDLVVANQEENSREGVEALEEAGLKVWVTFPRTVEDVLRTLYAVTRLFRLDDAVVRLQTLEVTLDWTQRVVSGRRVRYFCPIWYQAESDHGPWWMTFNGQTYSSDLLRHCNGENVFEERERRYPLEADLTGAAPEEPGERDVRYPRVGLGEIQEANPEMILLPSEPFAFDEEDRDALKELLAESEAVQSDRVHLLDGSLITWHGTRMAKALAELPSYFDIIES